MSSRHSKEWGEMYTEEEIVEKCYKLSTDMQKKGLIVKAYEEPARFGHTVATYKNEEDPALGKFFIEDTIARACFENDDCDAWQRLLDNEMNKL